MNGFTESNITLTFPDSAFFRLGECHGYKKLSGHHFKEMDACWYDAENDEYWLIELKDYTTVVMPISIEDKSWDIARKAIDTVCMFLSSKHNYPFAIQHLNPCFSGVIPLDTTKFRLVTIVHCNYSQKDEISLLNDSFRNKFKPYAELFGIQYYGVTEHTKARRYIPFLQ